MTNILVLSSILVLFASFVSRVETETKWSTENDAQEEEEKKLNNLFGNESSSSSHPPKDAYTTSVPLRKSSAEFWSRRLNVSDELHHDSKHDASPENSVDKDSLENVNDFLQESPVTEATVSEDEEKTSTETSEERGEQVEVSTKPSRVVLEIEEELPFSASKYYLIGNNSAPLAVRPSVSEDVASLNSFRCPFGDEKCKKLQTEDMSSKLNPSDTVAITDAPFLDQSNSSRLFQTPSFTSSSFSTLLVSPTQSASVLTSENTIAVDGAEVNKEEIVIQALQNKSHKAKPFLPDGGLENHRDEWTPLKSMTPFSNPVKDVVHSFAVTTPIRFVISSFLAPTDSPLPTASKDDVAIIKTNTYENQPSEEVKLAEMQVDASKTFKSVSSVSDAVAFENMKSISVFDDSKGSKVQNRNFLFTATSISPSFTDSVPSTSSQPIISSSFLELSSSLSTAIPTTLSTDRISPAVETVSTEQTFKAISTSPPTSRKPEPPPRLSNPSCSSLPACVEVTLLGTSWEDFCSQTYEFREFLSKSVSHYTKPVFPHHIVLDEGVCLKSARPPQNSPDIVVPFYVTDDSGEYEERLTEICGVILRKWAPTAFRSSVLEVRLYNGELQSTPLPLLPEFNSGFVAAVSISAVAGVALCLLCILLVIMKQKMLQGRNSDTTTPTADAYSLDSLSINASFRRRRTRRSARSYLNHAFSDQEIPSHPLSSKTIANCLKSRDLLEEEFKKIPMNMPKLDTIPEGAHVKNRYSNILPRPESRVMLSEQSEDPLKCYINANFVKGYDGKTSTYIACQAPLPEGIEDFWRMVWEQQSRVIVMLTMFEENGTSRCAMYFPQSTLVTQQPHGDFQVSLLKKDVYEFYTTSTLRLLDLEKNLFRDIVHLWFTGWPDVGVPKDPTSLMTFVQQCKPYINCNSGPTIVHCSTGTGRTGVFIALDICSREYEESRSMDILQCVWQLRKERAGAVQNKDQYILLYEAMLEYTTRVANQTHCPQNGTS